ncbi:glycosyltransferase [Thermophagus sp. OGC60D27]|uniref:glycosyltransferase n=1 Tax=Thermophagus sp. OGC60D27 TaxID=3458415 RepID=UPI00403826CC
MTRSKEPVANRPKTILICPLDWGLGHMSRDLPLIKEFRKHGHRVIVAASSRLIEWLKTEYSDTETVFFPGPEIRYGQKGTLILKLLFQLPLLIWWYFREKRYTANLISRYHPDLIISDNRYGVRHRSTFSVIVTHQLMLKLPLYIKWFEYPLHLLIKKLIQFFDECWVPDFKKEFSLAGDLVHKYRYPKNIKLIGPLSRFDDSKNQLKYNLGLKPGTLLAIISGPEPHRTLLEKELIKLFDHYRGKVCLIRGKGFNRRFLKAQTATREIYNHLPTPELHEKAATSEIIITRSGYSTIMDMYILKQSMFMIPTPGQTEQEYLAKFHHRKSPSKFPFEELKRLRPFYFTPPPDDIRAAAMKKDFREILKDFLE